MIAYFTGNTFSQVINEIIGETEQLIFSAEVSDELDFLKIIKQDITKYESIDTFILDESAFKNTEEEILTALEMMRTMYDKMKIIILAPYRETGDDFLTKCFNMGILNLINTSDFLEIRNELKICINTGKTYREAAKYKVQKTEKVVVRHELKKTVNKRLVGMAGTESNIGVTHNAIVLGNFFRKKGFMVAIVEMNESNAFNQICLDFEEKKFDNTYFTLNGVDFYPECNVEKLVSVMEHSYNFIILDFGTYAKCDRIAFERCEDKIIIAGSKSWETEEINVVFRMASKDTLLKYNFCFNFTSQKDHKAIINGMGEIANVYFLKYLEDPFFEMDFSGAEEIFADFLPEDINTDAKNRGLSKLLGFKNKKRG